MGRDTPLILYPNAVSSFDEFMVCRVSDGAIVQSNATKTRAQECVDLFDKHNADNGHTERFTVKTRTECRL